MKKETLIAATIICFVFLVGSVINSNMIMAAIFGFLFGLLLKELL